jgi:hypothetical protein
MFRIAVRQLQWTVLKPEFFVCVTVGVIGYVFNLFLYIRFSLYLGEPINIIEPFIAFSSNYVTVTISTFALLFLLSDLPYNAADDSFVLLRTTPRKWLMGKIIYLVMVCLAFYFAVAAVTVLLSAPFGFAKDVWSRTAEIMSFDDPMLSADLYMVSFYAPGILSNMTPIQAGLHSYLLVTLYSVTLGSIMMLLKILVSKQYVGLCTVYVIHALGYLPMLVIIGYRPFTLFGNALLSYHSFSEGKATVGNPRLIFSYILFSSIIAIAVILSEIFISTKKLNRGGQNG